MQILIKNVTRENRNTEWAMTFGVGQNFRRPELRAGQHELQPVRARLMHAGEVAVAVPVLQQREIAERAAQAMEVIDGAHQGSGWRGRQG